MITIKAFLKDEKGLYCMIDKNKHYYEVGKEYVVDTDKVKLCQYGFHASANCDISETIDYYPIYNFVTYCLVDLNVVEKSTDKCVGDRIKIIKELSPDECVDYDKTGKWCFEHALKIKKASLKKIEQTIVRVDKDGGLCYKLACYVKRGGVKKLEDAVIEKDPTGKWCYSFARHVKGANIKRLQDAVIESQSLL